MERSPRTSDPQWQMLTQHSLPAHLETLDHLATMVSVVTPEGLCLFANTAFEEALGLSRRAMLGDRKSVV